MHAWFAIRCGLQRRVFVLRRYCVRSSLNHTQLRSTTTTTCCSTLPHPSTVNLQVCHIHNAVTSYNMVQHVFEFRKMLKIFWNVLNPYNPLGNLNSGRSGPWAKFIRSASLQLVFDAAISKLLWHLVSRCFYMSICVFSTIRLNWLVQFECVVMWQNVYRQSPDGDREMFLNIMIAVCRILDKLHIFSNILCTSSIFIKMWAQI